MRRRTLLVSAPFLGLSETAFSVTFKRDQVEIQLPDGWEDASEPDVVAFEHAEYSQQLVIGEYRLKVRLDPESLRALHRQYTELRRNAEIDVFDGRATIELPSFTRKDDRWTSTYSGSHAPSGTRFRTVVLALETSLL